MLTVTTISFVLAAFALLLGFDRVAALCIALACIMLAARYLP